MEWFVKILTSIITLFVVAAVPNNIEMTIPIGVLALLYSMLTIYQVRDNQNLLVLFSIIFYINLSVFVLGPLTRGLTFGAYQFDMWNSAYNTIGMKCILISSVVFFVFFYNQNMKKRDFKKYTESIPLKDNNIISFICLIAVLLICTFSFNGSARNGEYVSNSNALYEYVIFIMALAWYYGGKSILMRFMWAFCAAYYLFIGLIAGDRSSAFMLMALIVLYKFKDLSIRKVLILCLAGIFAANAIFLFREGSIFGGGDAVLYKQGLRTFFSDTAAQSYYSGLTIYYYFDRIINDTVSLFINWVITIFSGSLFVDRTTVEFSKLAADYNFNGGGGLFQPTFYAFYGYLGVVLGSIIVAYLLKKVYYSWNNTFCMLLWFVIPAMSFRWYLYTPTTFFRACLFNFGILYLVAKVFDNMTKPSKHHVSKLVHRRNNS